MTDNGLNRLHGAKADEELWKHALEVIPNGTMTMSKTPSQFVNGVYPKFISRADGQFVFDRAGNKFIDLACALGPVILGYNHAKTNDAVRKQLESGIVFSLPHQLETEAADAVIATVPCAESVRFSKNGSDVTMIAARLARAYTGREHIAFCGYHGWGDSLGVAVRQPGIPVCFKNFIHKFQYNRLDSLRAILDEFDVGGVIMEAQALEAPQPGFLEGVRALCDKLGAVLIFDEVVSGFRWALGGAQERYGVVPDVCTIGKAMANGMPLSAVCGRRALMDELESVFFSSTFGGECLSLAACVATITELRNKDYEHIWRLGKKLKDGIIDAGNKHGLLVDMAGSPPRMKLESITFHDIPFSPKVMDLFFQEMCIRGVLFSNVIYVGFMHTEEVIDEIIQKAHDAFRVIRVNIMNPGSALLGEPSKKTFIRG